MSDDKKQNEQPNQDKMSIEENKTMSDKDKIDGNKDNIQKTTKDEEKKGSEEKSSLDEEDILLLKNYSAGQYGRSIKKLEDDIIKLTDDIQTKKGIRESDTGLAQPSQWDLTADKMLMQQEQPLQVARCTKIVDAGMYTIQCCCLTQSTQ